MDRLPSEGTPVQPGGSCDVAHSADFEAAVRRAIKAALTLKEWLGLPADARPSPADLERLFERLAPRVRVEVAESDAQRLPFLWPRRAPGHFLLLVPAQHTPEQREEWRLWALALVLRLRWLVCRSGVANLTPTAAEKRLVSAVTAAFAAAWCADEGIIRGGAGC